MYYQRNKLSVYNYCNMKDTFDIDESEVFKRKSFLAAKRKKTVKKIALLTLCMVAAAITAACIAAQFVE